MKIQTKVKRLNLNEVLKLVSDEKEIVIGKLERMPNISISRIIEFKSKSTLLQLTELLSLCNRIIEHKKQDDIKLFLNGGWSLVYVPDRVDEVDTNPDYFDTNDYNENSIFDAEFGSSASNKDSIKGTPIDFNNLRPSIVKNHSIPSVSKI